MISLSFNVVLLFLFNAFYVNLQYLSRNFSDGLNKYFGNKRDSLRIHKKETNSQLQTLSLRYLEKAYVRNWKWSVQNIFSLVQFPNQISIPCITGKHYITSLTDYSQVWFSCVHFNNERRRICTVLLVLWWKNLCAALRRHSCQSTVTYPLQPHQQFKLPIFNTAFFDRLTYISGKVQNWLESQYVFFQDVSRSFNGLITQTL